MNYSVDIRKTSGVYGLTMCVAAVIGIQIYHAVKKRQNALQFFCEAGTVLREPVSSRGDAGSGAQLSR
jgi:hypothetical protein